MVPGKKAKKNPKPEAKQTNYSTPIMNYILSINNTSSLVSWKTSFIGCTALCGLWVQPLWISQNRWCQVPPWSSVLVGHTRLWFFFPTSLGLRCTRKYIFVYQHYNIIHIYIIYIHIATGFWLEHVVFEYSCLGCWFQITMFRGFETANQTHRQKK